MSREKPRVLHFLRSGHIGGQEKAQYQLLRAFRGCPRLEVGVAIGDRSGPIVDEVLRLGIPVHDLGLKSGFRLRLSPRFLQEIRDYDIHHLHDPSPNYLLHSWLAGRRIKRVVTRRGGIMDYSKLGMKKRIRVFVNRVLMRSMVDGFGGNSANAVRSLKEQYGVTQPVSLLYNGLDFDLLTPTRARAGMRRKLGVSPEEFVVGTACRLVWWKRVDLLIRCFSELEVPEAKLVVFGAGPEGRRLSTLVSDLGLSERVLFPGEVSPMPDYLQVLDCFVLASSARESFGNAVVEALYLQIPSIVLSDSRGLREHVIHEKTGLVAEGTRDLTLQIQRFYRSPGLARDLGARGRASVVRKYSIDNMVGSHLQLYESVLGDGCR